LTEILERELSRRKFLAGSVAGLSLAVPAWFANEAKAEEAELEFVRQQPKGPNDQINIAVIGPGGSKGGAQKSETTEEATE